MEQNPVEWNVSFLLELMLHSDYRIRMFISRKIWFS